MSEYNLEIQSAKQRQRRFYGIVVSLLVVIGGLLVLWIGTVRVTTIELFPEEVRSNARISLKQGIGFVQSETVYSLSRETVISAVSAGFSTATHKIKPEEEGDRAQVTLLALPGTIRASTNAADPETRWFIDGKLVSVGSEISVEVEAGSHRLMADSPYHEPEMYEVSLARGETTQLKLVLSPVQGQLEITTSPAGAQVKIDGEIVGKSPLIVPESGGRYSVEISAPDRETLIDNIHVTNRRPNPSRNYQLEPRKGYLVPSLSPKNGMLIIDGKEISSRDRLPLSAIKKHNLSYQKAGYFTENAKFSLSSGEERKLTIKLRPEYGLVKITSQPQAEIWIDSKPAGITPVSLKLSAIRHNIKLKKMGYRTVEKQITPSSKSTRKIQVTLKSEKQLKLEKIKKEFMSKAGIKFKMFTPDRILMGAPRHEKGQRANEFQRDVILKKAFYVSLHEVTSAQYAQFKKSRASANSLPVTSIGWGDAAAFCNWLSQIDGLTDPFYRFSNGRYVGFNPASKGYRLPSEAEWEWLARKAGQTRQTIFTWGDDLVIPPDSGNFSNTALQGGIQFSASNYNDGFARLAPVGSFKPNKAGLFDLEGNVSEWVHDYYSAIPPRNNDVEYDPLGGTVGYNHVFKGASWRSESLTKLRPAFRGSAYEGSDDVGFRVARYVYK